MQYDEDRMGAHSLFSGYVQAKEEHPGATEEEGPWLFTLDFPSYMPIMTHAKSRRAFSRLFSPL